MSESSGVGGGAPARETTRGGVSRKELSGSSTLACRGDDDDDCKANNRARSWAAFSRLAAAGEEAAFGRSGVVSVVVAIGVLVLSLRDTTGLPAVSVVPIVGVGVVPWGDDRARGLGVFMVGDHCVSRGVAGVAAVVGRPISRRSFNSSVRVIFLGLKAVRRTNIPQLGGQAK